MELAQDRVYWRALVLAVLKLRVLLPQGQSDGDFSGCLSVTLIYPPGFCGFTVDLPPVFTAGPRLVLPLCKKTSQPSRGWNLSACLLNGL
jgi:hypothetical protein